MIRFLLAALILSFANMATAYCAGPNLYDQLPKADRAALVHRTAAVPWSSGLLWQVEKDGVTSYIIGTMHLPDRGLAPIATRVEGLLPSVDRVFLELTSADESALQNHLQSRPDLMFITQGPSLIDRLSDAEWAFVSKEAQQRGVPPFMAAKMQPWVLGMTVAIPVCAMEAMQSGARGLDRTLEARALQAGLPIASLDDPLGLIATLAAGSVEEQVEDMKIGLAMGLDPDDDNSIIALYLREEPVLIWEYGKFQARKAAPSGNVEELLQEFEKALITDRNQQWLQKLEPALSERPSLVAVGALHLGGQLGLLQLLNEQGFAITRLSI